jgi:hypothetical protein
MLMYEGRYRDLASLFSTTIFLILQNLLSALRQVRRSLAGRRSRFLESTRLFLCEMELLCGQFAFDFTFPMFFLVKAIPVLCRSPWPDLNIQNRTFCRP